MDKSLGIAVALVAILSPVVTGVGVVFTMKSELSGIKQDVATLAELPVQVALLQQAVTELRDKDFVTRAEASSMIELATLRNLFPRQPEPAPQRSNHLPAILKRGS